MLDAVPFVIRQIDIVVGVDRYAMRPDKQAFSPVPNVLPLRIKHDHRRLAAIEDEEIVS